MKGMSAAPIAVIMSGFPRRSETFALNELLALESRGLLTTIFATKPGDDSRPHPDAERLLDRVQVLPAGSPAEQAAVVVERLRTKAVTGIHAYFGHTPTEVAVQAARQLGVPYGFSVHARDARKIPLAELAARARTAACVIACNPDVGMELHAEGIQVNVIPHGVHIHRFHPHPFPPENPFRLLAVGRLVEKKGFDVLIQAATQLSFPFQLRIIGDGPEHERLAAAIAAAGLADRVALCGGQTHAQLPQEYREAHVVVVPSIVDQMGDRDGLPNVVLEAMASARPVVASDVGAMRSAICSGHNGILVPPGEADTLTARLTALACRPVFRLKLGHNARERVVRDFELQSCTDRFCRLLADTYVPTA